MELVIDISEEAYKGIQNAKICIGDSKWDNEDLTGLLLNAVCDGTPLPKGHGKLIDVNVLKKIDDDIFTMTGFSVRLCDIDNIPPIIEADEEETWRGR